MLAGVAIVVALAACAAAALAYGSRRSRRDTAALRARLESARVPDAAQFDSAALADLPPPVRRYFEAVLTPGQPIVGAATIDHAGTFDTGGGKWKPFTSNQRVVTERRGFDWNARIAIAPAIAVRVHDAYVAGEGLLHASLFGLMSVARAQGGDDLARGELMRFMAEAAWYPTALLPSEGVRWQPLDGRSALATLRDGDVEVSLTFSFDADGLIDTVHAQSRGRTVGRDTVPTPWQGSLRNYVLRDGMRIPLEGEVAWLHSDGPKPYWRGRIVRIRYEFEG